MSVENRRLNHREALHLCSFCWENHINPGGLRLSLLGKTKPGRHVSPSGHNASLQNTIYLELPPEPTAALCDSLSGCKITPSNGVAPMKLPCTRLPGGADTRNPVHVARCGHCRCSER